MDAELPLRNSQLDQIAGLRVALAESLADVIAMCAFRYRIAAGDGIRLSLDHPLFVRSSDPLTGETIMANETGVKCAHPICSCLTTTGKYCSIECEAMEKTPDIDCHCEHAGCKGKTS